MYAVVCTVSSGNVRPVVEKLHAVPIPSEKLISTSVLFATTALPGADGPLLIEVGIGKF